MTPDPHDYQQLKAHDPNGPVNCTAYSGAWLVDAAGGKTTGRKVRAATDEPKPDPKSPGLNLPQVDAAIRKLTPFDFDTRLAYDNDLARKRIIDGQWAEVQVIRGILVDHQAGGTNPFRGGHAITVHCDPGDGTPIIGDPLVPEYIRTTWGTLLLAAGSIAGMGQVNAMFTRDLIPDYTVSIRPTPPHKRREFNLFTVSEGKILRREPDVTTGFTQPCTPPRWYPWPGPRTGRSLVEITEGKRKGKYVRSEWADET